MGYKIDLTGEKFGHLTALSSKRVQKGNSRKTYWLCKCDCGNVIEVLMERLRNGAVQDCGIKCPCHIRHSYKDLTGMRFGKLIAIEKDENNNWKCQCDCGNIGKYSKASLTQGWKQDCGCVKRGYWLIGKRYGMLTIRKVIKEPGEETKAECVCDCGNTKILSLTRVINNSVKSCGCIVPETSRKVHTIHGKSKSRIYKIWKKMNDRCNNPNNKDYDKYGGRGIVICDEWSGEHGAENFIKWAYENGYDENAEKGKCTIDRINVDGNYEPSNCRWINMIEQSYNRRNTIRISVYGEMLTVKEISEKYNIPDKKVRRRYFYGIRDEGRLLYKGNLGELR